MTTLATLPDEDVSAILDQVWWSLLGVESAFGPVDPEAGDAVRTATVTISGPVPMLVALATSADTAVEVTRCLLDVEDPSADDVADALGELVNVLGGNLKSLLPGPSTLSLPVTTTGEVTPPSQATRDAHAVAAWARRPVTLTTYLLSLQGEPLP